MAWPDDAVEVAVVIDAWGIKGGLRLKPYAADPQALFSTKRWYIEAPGAGPRGMARVVQAREHADTVVATWHDIIDRDAALKLKGARVFVPRGSFPTADSGEFYWVDLIGLEVVNREGVRLGTVVDLMQTGPHSVLRVAPDPAVEGARVVVAAGDEPEVLIPFVDAYIDDVSLPARRITVDWQADY